MSTEKLLLSLLIVLAGCLNKNKDIGLSKDDSIAYSSRYNEKGLQFLHEKKFDNALLAYDTALMYDKYNETALFNRCQVYRVKKDYVKAIIEFWKFTHCEFCSDWYKRRISILMGLCFIDLGDEKTGQKILENTYVEMLQNCNNRLSASDSADIGYISYELSYIYINQEDFDKAQIFCKKALYYGFDSSYLYICRGIIKSRQHQNDSAIYYYKKSYAAGNDISINDSIKKYQQK